MFGETIFTNLLVGARLKKILVLEGFEKTMEGIYSTSVSRSTLDECATTDKPMDEIVANIQDTVVILDVIKRIYNFKAS